MKLVSVLAPCLAPLYRAVARHLGVDFDESLDWRECEQQLYRGEAELGFLCGLPYVRQADSPDPRLELLGAPVFRAPRYAGQPVYFSDLVVRANHAAERLDDLCGQRWVYNEPNSHSGYNVLKWRLRSEPAFFAEELAAGSHAEAIEWVLAGRADVACIDSTVLETMCPRGLRVIETLGPSPVQPLLVSRRLPGQQRTLLRQRLLSFPATGPVAGFVPVDDAHYDPIRATL